MENTTTMTQINGPLPECDETASIEPSATACREWAMEASCATERWDGRMISPRLEKLPSKWTVTPNLADYGVLRREFSWERERRALDGLPMDAGLNIAHLAVDRHVLAGRGEHVAIRWLDRAGEGHDFTYRALAESSARFAQLLGGLGVRRGERVFVLAGRIPELYITALGALKYGSVFCPLFSAFGPEPIQARMSIGEARVLVTTEPLYRRKIEPIRESLPALKFVLLVGDAGATTTVPGTADFHSLLAAADSRFDVPATDPEDMALLHFTSGTTGRPKGAIHVHSAAIAHFATARYALDLHPDDIFWCTADPGWVTGTSYGIVAPLLIGATMVVDSEEFDAQRWYRILETQRVSVWYTAPTAVRMLMKLGTDLVKRYDTSSLRFLASVGEPLNPEAVVWGMDAFGLPFHDNWWQTETGGIMIANYAAVDIKPGSMGCPMPGIEAAIVRRRGAAVEVLEEPGIHGELALRPGWPSMFRGYLGEEQRYRACFAGDWYLSGDLAMRDDEGYFWFIGRSDDVIKSAGHLIGPFEVESALMEHPSVAEAGAIGKPDTVAMEVVKVFVALKPGYDPSEALRREILGFARKRLGVAVAPKELEFRPGLPKTRSGKIMRRLLKARELGLPEGDISTLESEQ